MKRRTQWCDRTLMVGPYFALATTEARFTALLDHLGIPAHERHPWLEDNTLGRTHYFDRKDCAPAVVVVVPIDPERTPISVAGTLVHEAVHVWQRHCEYIGEHEPSKEFEAYSIERLATELMEQYASQIVNAKG